MLPEDNTTIIDTPMVTLSAGEIRGASVSDDNPLKYALDCASMQHRGIEGETKSFFPINQVPSDVAEIMVSMRDLSKAYDERLTVLAEAIDRAMQPPISP